LRGLYTEKARLEGGRMGAKGFAELGGRSKIFCH
jgi:hypothetical protein